MDLKRILINTRNWVDFAQDRDYWRTLVNGALNLELGRLVILQKAEIVAAWGRTFSLSDITWEKFRNLPRYVKSGIKSGNPPPYFSASMPHFHYKMQLILV